VAHADDRGAANEIASSSTTASVSDVVFKAVGMIGTRYQRGGQTPDAGFDCSGFVRYVFAHVLQRDLPRTSAEMSALGDQITREQLQPGDLVFYNTLKRAFSHVGIYIGEGRFVHAPSRGRHVEIVDMADRYWQRRFNGARRLVEPSRAPAAEVNTEATTPQTDSAP
jgi:cell wall-associated NlpC family hydrolase